MNILIVYDTVYKNTEEVAKTMAGAVRGDVKLIQAKEVKTKDLEGLDVLIVGSPTQGGRSTSALQQFLAGIPADGLKNVKVVAFDTRFSEKEVNLALRLLIKTIGYAAEKIAKTLESKGGRLIAAPEGFIVAGKKGPLRKGEQERAVSWIKEVLNNK